MKGGEQGDVGGALVCRWSSPIIKSESRPLAEQSCVRHRRHRRLAAATFSQQPLPWQLAHLSPQACKED